MRRNNAEQIGRLIREYLREESLETPLNECRLVAAWPEVTGPAITSYTRELYIKNQVLYVYLTSAALRQELMMSRIPVMEALVFITIVTVISVELYMNIKQPLFTDPVHPMYPVYMLVRVFYIMFLMGCVLGCFLER